MLSENYKMLLKENKDLNNQKDILGSWVQRLNSFKMATLPIATHTGNAIPMMIQRTFFFFQEIDELIVKLIRNCKSF